MFLRNCFGTEFKLPVNPAIAFLGTTTSKKLRFGKMAREKLNTNTSISYFCITRLKLNVDFNVVSCPADILVTWKFHSNTLRKFCFLMLRVTSDSAAYAPHQIERDAK